MATTKNDKEILQKIVSARSIFEQFKDRESLFRSYSSATDSLYDILDFPRKVTYSLCKQRFERQDIANRIISAPVLGSWKYEPRVYDSEDGETPFSTAFENLSKEIDLYQNLTILDTLASLGQFSVLYMGLADGVKPENPTSVVKNISFITPIPEDQAMIHSWNNDITSPRYGMPEKYTITITIEGTTSISQIVHWSRVLHVAENILENKVYGNPALAPVFNRLIGLDRIAGASPSVYWKGLKPIVVAEAPENTIMSTDQTDIIKDELEKLDRDLKRHLVAQGGMKVSSLAPQVVSPVDHVTVQLKLISASTRIPLRILVGSERGELASTQDETSWLAFLEERRTNTAEKLILRPFIDKCISIGLLPPPEKNEFFVDWPPLITTSDKEKAEIAEINTKALEKYCNSPMMQSIIQPEMYLEKIMGFTKDESDLMIDPAYELLEMEDAERPEEDKKDNSIGSDEDNNSKK
jgi:hypothetical protein